MHLRTCFANSGVARSRILVVRATLLMAAGAMLFLSSGTVFGQSTPDLVDQSANPATYGVESDFCSRYVWHGLASSSDGVMQNCAWVSKGGLTGSVWSNYDLAAQIEGPRFNEYNFAVAYASAYKKLNLEIAVQAVVFPNQTDNLNTTETSVDWSLDAGHLQPFLIYTVDVQAYRGASFGEAGLRSAWDATETLAIEASAGIGWGSTQFNEAYVGERGQALNVAAAEIGLTWNCVGGLYLRPHALVTTLLDTRLRGAVDTPDIFQIGIAVGGEF